MTNAKTNAKANIKNSGAIAIASTFATLQERGSKAFVPFIMAGDPSLAETAKIATVLAESGADIIELGVPFSDPIADGVANQKAAERALAAGTDLEGVLAMVRGLRADGLTTPIVLFSYLNPIFSMGFSAFAEQLAAAGVDGALILDLPPEHAEDYQEAMASAGRGTIFLCSPTTTPDRLALIDKASTGFVYCVAQLGVTGQPSEMGKRLDFGLIAEHITKPMVLGFGVSTPEQAKRYAELADGVVVGSAIVRQVEAYGQDRTLGLKGLAAFAHDLKTAIHDIDSL